MAELVGAIASGIGIASFAIQLAESVKKLKTLCDDIKDAREAISFSLQQLDILTLQVQEIANEEQENPDIFASSISLQQCIALSKQGITALAVIVNELEKDMVTGKRIWGKLKVVLKKDALRKLASRLESASQSLMLSYMIYSNALHRLDTHLIVTEVRKVQISTHHSSLTTNGASVSSLTGIVSSSLQLQSPQGQNNSIAAETTRLQDSKSRLLGENSLTVYDTRQERARRTRYHLRLPFFITNRAWELTISRPQGGWDAKLRTYNIIPDDSLLFEFCRAGDLQGVQALFSSGEASPFDVDSNGNTALRHAIKHMDRSEEEDRLMNITRLSQFIIRQGLDPEQCFRDCFNELALTLTVTGSSLADINNFVEWIGVFLAGVQLDVAPVQGEEMWHFLNWASDVVIIEEIKLRANDPPFEQLTIDQRLSLAINAYYPRRWELMVFRSSRNTKILDLFTARLGGEMTGLAIETIFNGQHDVDFCLYQLLRIYGQAASEGDARAEPQLLGILEAAIENGVDLHREQYEDTYMGLFVKSYCDVKSMTNNSQLSGRAQQSAIERMAQDAVQVWLKILFRIHVDLRLYCEEGKSSRYRNWHLGYVYPGSNSFESARLIISNYGELPEEWHVMTSWRLNDDIPEASAGDFWDMLEHPERQMPGFWDDELDSRYYYDKADYSWMTGRKRRCPNRHERRKGMLDRREWGEDCHPYR